MVVLTRLFNSFRRYGEVGKKMPGFIIRKQGSLPGKSRSFQLIYRVNMLVQEVLFTFRHPSKGSLLSFTLVAVPTHTNWQGVLPTS
ncbi:hypothetical protein D3C85_1564070 [compost metagenome]